MTETKEENGVITQTQKAYNVLKEDILSGALAPGKKLKIEFLKKHYRIGPTPLREALSRLVSSHHVINIENRGFYIPEMSLEDLKDITEQRKLIECAALRKSIESSDPQFEVTLLQAHYQLSRVEEETFSEEVLQEWEVRHRKFHQTLIGGSHSQWLDRFQVILLDQADRYRRLYLPQTHISENSKKDHKEILDATLDRDADSACHFLAKHIDRIYEYTVAHNIL